MDDIEMLKTLGNTFADYPHAAQGSPQERCANMVAAIENVVAEDYFAAMLTDEPLESWRSRTDENKADIRRGLARVAYLRDQIQQHCCLAMTAHDVQFNLCEAYKYLRMRAGEGKPRSRYKPPQPVKAKGGFFAI